MINSGAMEHITPYATDFTNYTTIVSHRLLSLADGNTRLQVKGQGTVKATTMVDGRRVEVQLPNVLHIPGIGKRFLSMRRLDQKGFEITHSHATATIKNIATGQICEKG